MVKNKVFLIFLVVVLAQLFVPAKMIWDREVVIDEGTVFKFKTAPIDPYDPFRGRYVRLNFDIDRYETTFSTGGWKRGEDIYVTLTTDSLGFAKIAAISHDRPAQENDYVLCTIGYVNNWDESDLKVASLQFDQKSYISINFPFERFYMQESLAQHAEDAYRSVRSEPDQVAYAQVTVIEGNAVLTNVFINGKPLVEWAKERLDAPEPLKEPLDMNNPPEEP